MNKDQMAHEYLLTILEAGNGLINVDERVRYVWQLADAMQVEADKRASQKRAELRELLNHPNTFVEKEGQHFDDVNFEVDWDQAPGWAEFWAKDACGEYAFYSHQPSRVSESGLWISIRGESVGCADFGYTGCWHNSLRKRHEMEAEHHG